MGIQEGRQSADKERGASIRAQAGQRGARQTLHPAYVPALFCRSVSQKWNVSLSPSKVGGGWSEMQTVQRYELAQTVTPITNWYLVNKLEAMHANARIDLAESRRAQQ